MTSLAETRDPPSARALPADLRLGAVRLTVSNLDRSVAWYERSLGLHVGRHEATTAELGDGRYTVLMLVEDSRARPAGRHAGLFHYALLYPTREELARAAVRLSLADTPIEGASDHGTHEALYLPDPDGNGIELAADRPREVWPKPEEEYSSGPRALDLPSLLDTIAGEPARARVAPGLRVGHLHLHVGDVDRGLVFYRDVLGFELSALLPSAAFVSAGGYHHHLGFNVWRGRGSDRRRTTPSACATGPSSSGPQSRWPRCAAGSRTLRSQSNRRPAASWSEIRGRSRCRWWWGPPQGRRDDLTKSPARLPRNK